MRAPIFAVVTAVALVAGAAAASVAQMDLGVIKGRVVDDAGAPLDAVTIRTVQRGNKG